MKASSQPPSSGLKSKARIEHEPSRVHFVTCFFHGLHFHPEDGGCTFLIQHYDPEERPLLFFIDIFI
jgi:hypothetical protein